MLFIISLVLIFFNAAISMLEVAVISIREFEELRESIAHRIKMFRENPRYFLFSVAVLRFIFFALAFILIGLWAQGDISLFLIAFFIVFVSFYFIRMAYKFVERKPGVILKALEPLLFLVFLFFKVSLLLPENFVFKISPRDVSFVKREFEFLIREVKQDEAPDQDQLLRNVLEFNDKTVREIMIPRTKVVALDINAPREKVVKVVLNEGYSRLPVYKETIDNIVGIVYAKDLINYIEEPNLFVLYDLLRPAYFVPETKKISELLKELQRNKIHMAIVVDEFSGFQGIVTLEDILEEIVGEIHDEYDRIERNYEILDDGSIIIDASMLVGDFNKKFDVDIPKGSDYESVGGFVSKLAGRIPEEGERIRFKNLIFEILKRSKRKIIKLKISMAE